MPFESSPIWSAVGPSYEWPRKSIIDDVNYVTHGRFGDLPPSSSKIVRIFMSSTFTDTYTERNLLMKNVYPKLQKLCKEKYDLDFQVVDMRWGVRNEATVDHSASELCMSEIEACKQYSIGPTFVALLSHRYGGRHAPTPVPCEEMNKLKEEIGSWETSQQDLTLVEKWYQLDKNAIPNEYILQPIINHTELENLYQQTPDATATEDDEDEADLDDSDEEMAHPTTNSSKVELDKTKKAKYKKLVKSGKELWKAEEPVLKKILQTAAQKCHDKGILKDEHLVKFFQSITEEEIRRGLLEETDKRNRCLVFRRTVKDININHEKAWRFIDKNDDGTLDNEAQDLLINLRDTVIPKSLPKENIIDFTTSWSDNEGINEQDHEAYLKEFCDSFERAILDLIERGVSKASIASISKVYSEVLEHSHQCLQKVERFHGREDELQQAKEYILSTSDQPLIVYGESGCGKTSLLAKAAIQIPEWIGDNKSVSTVLRFLGTTPDSSTVYKMLSSLSNQVIALASLQDRYPELPQEFADLKDTFKDILASVPADKKIVLIIDSLDQLSETNAAHKLLWFPSRLPPHVKVIASTLPTEYNILTKLKSKEMNLDEHQFVPVQQLKTETSHQILKLWLEKKHRCLSQTQEDMIDDLIQKDVRPLYLKLIFDEISNWKSYETPTFKCPTIASCLQRLYIKLEIKHGEMLVKKALGYLSASKNGLTKIEVEDILSLDDDVLNDVFEFHVPPVRRLPSILWARIRRDLTEYIVDRDADGAKVMAWYHRQFIQEAHKRYLPGTSAFGSSSYGATENIPLYKALMDYFAGVWGGTKKKPFTYTKSQIKKLNLESPESSAERYVPEQPTVFRSEDGNIDLENLRYNLRKITELPHACQKVASHEDNTAYIAEHIALNPEFLAAWIKSSPWEEVAEFLNEISRDSQYASDSRELTRKFKKSQDETKKKDEEDSDDEEEFNWDDLATGTPGLVLQISTVQQGLLLSYISVLNNPTYLGADLTGRLLPYNGLLDGIVNWIKYTDGDGRHMCALVPPHLQLESPGSELMFVINNHIGPVQDACWSEADNNTCLSVSKKFVVVSLEAGQIMIDTKPRSMPEGDTFNKVMTIHHEDQTTYVASLLKAPLIYTFSVEGEVLSTIDVAKVTSKTLTITDMTWFPSESKSQIVVRDKSLNTVFYLSDIPNDNVTAVEVGNKDTGKVLALFVSKKHNTEARVLLLKETNTWELYDEDGKLLDKKQFSWPKISSISEDQNAHCSVANIVVGFLNGQICIVNWNRKKLDLGGLAPKYLLRKRILESSIAPYGVAHYLYPHTAIGEYSSETIPIALSCSNSHLCVFGDPEKMFQDYSSSSDSDSEGDVTEKEYKEKMLKLLCRIKKRFDTAAFTPEMKFILATRGGTIDVLKIGDQNIKANGFKAQYFATIDAHGQEITRILATDEDILFMTASKDSSLKFYMLARAGITKKYIPNFDHTEHDIKEIFPGSDMAVTFTKQSRFIHQWEVVHGKIRRIFQHPRNHLFLKCATDGRMENLVALDEDGNCFRWTLREKEGSNLGQTRLRRRTTSKLKPASAVLKQAFVEAPHPLLQVENALALDKESESQSIHMMLFNNNVMVVAFKNKPTAYVTNVIEGGKAQEITGIRGPFRFALKMNEEALLVSKTDCGIVNLDQRNIKQLWPLEEVVGANFEHLSDVSFVSAVHGVLLLLKDRLVLWKPAAGSSTKPTSIQLKGMNPSSPKIILSTNTSDCVVIDKEAKQYCKVDISSRTVPDLRELSKKNQTVQDAAISPDGKYMLYVSGDKDLHLVRLSDGKLLAWYTMYDTVQSLSVSANSWYALVGTSDKRLFVLVIADPHEPSHDKRIQYVRNANPPLTQEQMATLMGDVNNFDFDSDVSDVDSSDDEYLIEKATKRMQQRADNALGTKLTVLYSSDSSGEDEEEDEMVKRRSKSRVGDKHLHREQSIGADPVPAYDGEFFTAGPCSLQ